MRLAGQFTVAKCLRPLVGRVQMQRYIKKQAESIIFLSHKINPASDFYYAGELFPEASRICISFLVLSSFSNFPGISTHPGCLRPFSSRHKYTDNSVRVLSLTANPSIGRWYIKRPNEPQISDHCSKVKRSMSHSYTQALMRLWTILWNRIPV